MASFALFASYLIEQEIDAGTKWLTLLLMFGYQV